MKPFISTVPVPGYQLTPHDNHIVRRLSSMRGQYHDAAAYGAMLASDDLVLYEVYENHVPDQVGELQHGISIVHPGKVGDEYFMTKGHFHAVLDTAEVYYTLAGQGYMLMETPEGETSQVRLELGTMLYVPPRWAHRSVNVGEGDLVMLFIYPGDAGHDYATIETKGFRRLLLDREGAPTIVDNPRWGE